MSYPLFVRFPFSRFPFSVYQLFIINYELNIVVWPSQSDGVPWHYPPTKDRRPKTINQRSRTKLIFKEENNKKNLENKKNGCNFALANAGSYSSVGQSTWLIIRESLVQAQVGPLLKNQAVTKQIVAAFSFTLNTNLNTTQRQLDSGATGTPLCSCPCVHALVFKLWLKNCKSTSFLILINNDESKENNKGEPFFLPSVDSPYILV